MRAWLMRSIRWPRSGADWAARESAASATISVDQSMDFMDGSWNGLFKASAGETQILEPG